MILFVENKTPDLEAVASYLELSSSTNQWTNFGPVSLQLETAIHGLLAVPESKSVVTVSSGTSGLYALLALESFKAGRQVRAAVSAFTFACQGQGPMADSVVVDCDAHGALDLDALAAVDESSYDVIVVTHVFGRAQRLEAYADFARSRDKFLIYDAATCFGSEYEGRPIAAYGDASLFSLHHTKPAGVGEGGFVVIDREHEVAFRSIINFGMYGRCDTGAYSTNAKMSDVAAAFILDRIARFPELCLEYREQYDRVAYVARSLGLELLLGDAPGVHLPAHVPILLSRKRSLERLTNLVVTVRKYYRPLREDAVLANDLYERIVCVPCHGGLSALDDAELEDVLGGFVDGRDVGRGGRSGLPGLGRKRPRASSAVLSPDTTGAPRRSILEGRDPGRSRFEASVLAAAIAELGGVDAALEKALEQELADLDSEKATSVDAGPLRDADLEDTMVPEPGAFESELDEDVAESDAATLIGGPFGLEEPTRIGGEHRFGLVAGRDTIAFASARGALRFVVERATPPAVWLPSFSCPALSSAVRDAGVAPSYFAIDERLRADDSWVEDVGESDVVVLIAYFGVPIRASLAASLRARGAIVIEDACHTWEAPEIGSASDLVLRSPRKIVGVPDGGLLTLTEAGSERLGLEAGDLAPAPPDWWTNALEACRMRAVYDQQPAASDWIGLSRAAEAAVPTTPHRMSPISDEILPRVDFDAVARRRRANYAVLRDGLASWELPLEAEPAMPYAFAMRTPARDAVRSALLADRVLTPEPWEIDASLAERFSASGLLGRELVLLPCDQRYDALDMKRMIDVVRRTLEGRGS